MKKPADDDLVKNFIAHYKALVDRSPHLAVHNFRCENSDYSDQLNDSRNAYVCFNGYDLQDCYYNYDSRWNKDCADLSYSNKCQFCYDCIDCEDCYNSNFIQDCERCSDCSYCYDCFSCQDCFGCVGLRRAKYNIFNVSCSKTDYPKKLKEAKTLSEKDIRSKMEELRLKHPHVAMRSRNSEHVLGNYIFNSKEAYYAFKSHKLEDSHYVYNSRALKDCVDVGMTFKSELIYEAIEDTDNYNCNFLYWCANCRDCEYIMYCFDCTDCFGCFNLKRKKYHILDQPYEKKEYFELVAKIKAVLRENNQYNNFLPDIIRKN